MVMSRTFEYMSKSSYGTPQDTLEGQLTMVRLFETCLSNIPQTETPLISRTTFGPSLVRRSLASVSEIPFLERSGEREILGYRIPKGSRSLHTADPSGQERQYR